MSSDRLRQANRANAARSTGPRSRAGKATAARNAQRYGLSLPVMADAALAPEVAALARAIAGETGQAMRAAPPLSASPKPRSTLSASEACGSP